MTSPGHLLNLFPVSFDRAFPIDFRLAEVRGVPAGPEQPAQLQAMVKQVTYRTKQPAVLIELGQRPLIAVPSATALRDDDEFNLTPSIATLKLMDQEEHIDAAFVEFALRGALMRDPDLWGGPRRWFSKQPDNAVTGRALFYPGFFWQVLDHEGLLYVSIDPTAKYVASRHANSEGPPYDGLRWKHCLYRFGQNWFGVQIVSVLTESIRDHRFHLPDGTKADVLTWTKDHCGDTTSWIRDLDPNSPAIIYQYPGNNTKRAGALQLCYVTYPTDDPSVSHLHRRSILAPADRLCRASAIAMSAFKGAPLNGHPLTIGSAPLTVPAQYFHIPALAFGNNRVLRTSTFGDARSYPQQRAALVNAPDAGPITRAPFGQQYLVIPQSMPRLVSEDFQDKFLKAMRHLAHDSAYATKLILYDDRNATTLHQHVQAVHVALQNAGVTAGHGLLVLPPNAPPHLHHWVKAGLQPQLQFKCAAADTISKFYGGGPAVTAGKYNSYLENCAMGVLLVNRHWPWALADDLHYDLHVGIDVLSGIAGFTFVYDRGRRIFFDHRPGVQQERLSSKQLATALTDNIAEHIGAGCPRPQSVLLQRDGRLLATERLGADAAVRRLQKTGHLPLDATIGYAEIHKHTSNHLRLVEGRSSSDARPARIGSWWALNDSEGMVCSTGSPFVTPGTPLPLAVSVSGTADLRLVLEDIFRLSQLGFSAPRLPTRLPVTIKLADDFLEAVAAEYDEEGARYDFMPELEEGA